MSDKELTHLHDSFSLPTDYLLYLLYVFYKPVNCSMIKTCFLSQKIIVCGQVVSNKKLVKHLQKEVARLEAELRSPEPSSSTCLKTLLMEKDLKIQQVMNHGTVTILLHLGTSQFGGL